MKSKPKKAKRRRGRPSRATASKKALAKVDLTRVDPKQVLLAVAADSSAPAMARVTACRALLAASGGKPDKPDETDAVTQLALQLLRRKP